MTIIALPKWPWIIAAYILAVGAFPAAYFGRSEIFVAEFRGSVITFRLFEHEWERKLWGPLVIVEAAIRPGEFYGHTKNGASLPFADGHSENSDRMK